MRVNLFYDAAQYSSLYVTEKMEKTAEEHTPARLLCTSGRRMGGNTGQLVRAFDGGSQSVLAKYTFRAPCCNVSINVKCLLRRARRDLKAAINKWLVQIAKRDTKFLSKINNCLVI